MRGLWPKRSAHDRSDASRPSCASTSVRTASSRTETSSQQKSSFATRSRRSVVVVTGRTPLESAITTVLRVRACSMAGGYHRRRAGSQMVATLDLRFAMPATSCKGCDVAIRTSASTAPATATLVTRRDGDTLVVQLGGQWQLRAGLPSTAPVEQALAITPPPRSVAFDTTGLTSWDSSGLAVLDHIATLSKARQIAIQPDGLPEGLQRLFARATGVPGKRDAHVAPPPPWLARVGSAAQGAWEGTLSAIEFLGEATLAFGRFLRGTAIFQWRDVLLVL